jgi:hypothetical protein
MTAAHVPVMDKMNQLKDRVDARKHELMAKLHDLRADGRKEADVEKKSIQARLDELQDAIKDGWDKATDRLESWLSKKN